MSAADHLGRQFQSTETQHADSWFPNETDEDGTYLDHDEARRSLRASRPMNVDLRRLTHGRDLN